MSAGAVGGRLSHLLTANADVIDPSAAGRERKYNDRERFRMHQRHAERRGIPFLFTFDTWLAWWKATGHYEERGRLGEQYVMGRKGDKGAYEPGNVECIRVEENIRAAHVGRKASPQQRQNMREAARKRVSKRAGEST